MNDAQKIEEDFLPKWLFNGNFGIGSLHAVAAEPATTATSVGIAQVCRIIIVGKILLMLLRWLHIM